MLTSTALPMVTSRSALIGFLACISVLPADGLGSRSEARINKLGKGCLATQGVLGTCVLVSECMEEAEEIIAIGMRPVLCGFHGKEPIVCCTMKNGVYMTAFAAPVPETAVPIRNKAKKNSLGKSCLATQGGRGTCLLASECKEKSIELIRKGLRPVLCGFQGTQPIVCCPGDYEEGDLTAIAAPVSGVAAFEGSKINKKNPLGKSCLATQGGRGTCLLASECKEKSIKLLSMGLRPVLCGFQGRQPIVCCAGEYEDDVKTAIAAPVTEAAAVVIGKKEKLNMIPLGDSCLATQGDLGTCALVSECMAESKGLIEMGKRPVLCGFHGKQPVVCCTGKVA